MSTITAGQQEESHEQLLEIHNLVAKAGRILSEKDDRITAATLGAPNLPPMKRLELRQDIHDVVAVAKAFLDLARKIEEKTE